MSVMVFCLIARFFNDHNSNNDYTKLKRRFFMYKCVYLCTIMNFLVDVVDATCMPRLGHYSSSLLSSL